VVFPASELVPNTANGFIQKTAVYPPKTRKAQNKSVCCVDSFTHPLADSLHNGISLNIFVIFVDEIIFAKLTNPIFQF
jgi:hypothetical protein